MKRLCIGIIELTTGWKVLLDQLGVWYDIIEFNPELLNNYSTIILNRPVSEEEEDLLHNYVNEGGSVLETQDGEVFSYARYNVTKKVEHLDNKGTIPFLNHISTLDVFTKAELYNGFDYFDGLIDFERHEKGIVCNLGINPDALMADNTYSRKRFPFKKEKHPDELVSNVSKTALSQLVLSLLKELHLQQKMPFVCKWTSPKKKPVFAFRIDSDFGDRESVTAFSKIGKEHDIPITWFLHVQAHEEWLKTFHDFEGQEIALHGYEHGTSDSYENIFNNIEKGLQLLRDAGFDPKGFCVPYAIWNDPLAEVLQKFEFNYSSEFTVGYDGLPFSPIHQDKELDTLQIPIHPICTGSLHRKKVSEEEMKSYFLNVMNEKLARYEPVVFYHHPMQPGMEIWKDIFAKVKELDLCSLSFEDYASFWKKRTKTNFEAFLDPETSQISFSADSTELLLQVSDSQTSFELVNQSESKEVQSSGKFTYHPVELTPKEELAQLRSGKLQLMKASLLDRKNRIKL